MKIPAHPAKRQLDPAVDSAVDVDVSWPGVTSK